MAAAQPVKKLSPVDAAYIAGLIDGEGTITLTRKHRNENRQLAISISSTEKNLLEFVLSTAGVGKITNKRIAQAHHTPSFVYAIYNRQALDLLEQLLPYLRGYKTRRAKLILRDYIKLTPRNGKYTPEQRLARKHFESCVLDIKP